MTIGIIEDDRLLSRSLKVVLEKEGYRTLQVYTKKDAGQILQGTEELLLVDIGLPDGNGMELYHTLMKKWNRKIPAIFLTARDEEQEMLKAFDLGAEDYVVKPFSMKVLLKRIEVAFRRNRGEDAGEQILKCRDLTLYPQRKKAVSGEKEISLTAKEYQLLEYLMKNQGQVLTKENILEHVWGIDGQYVVDNSVSVLVGRLRKKIEAVGEQPYIQNVFGLGYRMEEEWSAGMFLLGILAGAAGMYRGQRKERSRELKKISDTVQRMTSGKELPDFSDCEETMDSKIRHQLLRLQEILVSQKQDAQKERKELQELISEIAHQMRTPLTNLKNYLDFLSEEIEKKGTEPELSYLKAIQSSEEKIYFLTEHFIRISRLEHGLIQIRKEERDLLKTLRNALGQILDQAEKKEIRFEFELPEKMHVMHDANWLGEAIFNLLDNAVKYSPQNGKIKISLQENEMFTTFSIRDYGIGIEPEEKNLIFQRFYRGKRVTDEEGFGIGLYLARKILFLHEGLLTVKRCEPGVEMKLSLPRQ